MSLPMLLKVFSKENDLLARGFINVGRFIDAEPLVREIRTCLFKLNKTRKPTQHFAQLSSDWKERMEFIEVYGFRIPKELIRKICSKMTVERFDECVKELKILL